MPTLARIVVLLPNWVGDAVMATPALRALRTHFRRSHIAFVGREIALETLNGLDLADATALDRSGGGRPGAIGATISTLRAGRYDLALLLPNSFRVAAAAKLAGIRRIAGYVRDGRGWMLTDKLDPPRDEAGEFRPVSAIDYYNDLVSMLGAECTSRRMSLAVGGAEAAAAGRMLPGPAERGHSPIVMLNPGASFGVSKMWDPERYAALADALIERRGVEIIINAAPNERAIAARVAGAMTHQPLLNMADHDNSISLLKALVQRSAVVVTNDTGARHVAAALGVGVVTLFGSTDPEWARIDCPRERIIRVELPCSPCQKAMCPQPAGPLYHRCMSAITPDMVIPAVEELLDIVEVES